LQKFRQISEILETKAESTVIQTWEHTYWVIGEWNDMDSLVNARSYVRTLLLPFRDSLAAFGCGLGVTTSTPKLKQVDSTSPHLLLQPIRSTL
jgi:hypothetical protein